jgi:competence ComEA-like helix-hairpin-helix protein
VFLHETIAETEGTPDVSDNISYVEAVNDNIPVNGLVLPVFENCGGTTATVKLLWGRMTGNPGWTETKYMNNNNHSVVARVDYGQASILFTGDLEEEAIQRLVAKYQESDLLDTDVYLAGHHGSKNGTTKELIEEVTPEIAVLSFGSSDREEMWTAWAYGHPNKDVIAILEEGCSKTRAPKQVMVGTKAKKFTRQTITKAIDGTGWDEHIVLQANADGAWSYAGELSEDIKVNINTADIAMLEGLPSIGPARAQAIVDYRSTHGNFTSIDQLDEVPGIGPATIVVIRARIVI